MRYRLIGSYFVFCYHHREKLKGEHCLSAITSRYHRFQTDIRVGPEFTEPNDIGLPGIGQLDGHACEQLLQMIGFINGADFRNAMEVHKGLTTTHWTSDKDWLKGIKCLIQLCQKKFVG